MNTLLRIAYFAVLYGLLSLASPAATEAVMNASTDMLTQGGAKSVRPRP